MGYYMRVLTPSETCFKPTQVQEYFRTCKIKAVVEADDMQDAGWENIVFRHPKGSEIAAVERSHVESGSIGSEEIAEFDQALAEALPTSGADWVRQYLKRVKNVYAIQVLSGSEKPGGWKSIRAFLEYVKDNHGGIVQADGEGFSNEGGWHVVWDFSDVVEGDWGMAVLKNGKWVCFRMELGDRQHRKAFKAGNVPAGCQIVEDD